MEDRTSAGLYLEMTNVAADAYAAERLGAVRTLPGVGVVTLWRNQLPGRDDYPRTVPEFETLAVYEVDADFDAPACPEGVWIHHYERTARPAQGLLGAGPTLGLEVVLVSPSSPELRQALRDWADLLHIREIAAAVVPGMAMITPYEKRGEGDPRFLHLYEIDQPNAESAFQRMAPLTIARVREHGGKEAVARWMDDESLRIDYINSFTRVIDAD